MISLNKNNFLSLIFLLETGFSLCLFCTIISTYAEPSQPSYEPITRSPSDIRKEESEIKALKFEEAIGFEPKGKAESALVRDTFADQRLWVTKYGEPSSPEAIIKIDSTTGETVSFVNFTRNREIFKDRKPANLKIDTEFKAAQKAEGYLRAMGGVPLDAKFKNVIEMTDCMGPDPRKIGWTVQWVRTHNGYEYDDNWISVTVDRFEGKVLGYRKFWVASTCPTRVKVEKEAAIALAKSYLPLKYQSKLKASASAELKIVMPNKFWSGEPPDKEYDKNARLAWVVSFVTDEKEPEPVIVWVDAADRKLLGGLTTM